ncbi:YcnI family protein [Agromyces sp. Marseille-P2726]|uniref:YcnI family copper-binding membrane protein n=1 Tax=Agromyces sp. Marseille-P2726 TaxID=2709132 RepID=UPI001570C5C8|nr:YcnI family protein [Agromyces sp. Marseille-P2726]
MRHARLTIAGLAGGALLALAVPTAAQAHVSVTPSSTAAGSSSVLTFAFSHGCDGSPTTALTFDIPESIASVSPTVHPGWTIEKIADGDRTAQVVYTAVTPVEDGFRDTIELSVRLPEDAAGETLAFPVLQSCAVGETNWSEVAEEGEAEPESPAPTILVTEATGDEHGHGAEAPADDSTDEHSHDEATEVSDAAATTSSDDTIARVLAIGGLAVGVVGIVLALTARRGATKKP